MSSIATTLETIPESMGIFNKFEDKLPYKSQKKDNSTVSASINISAPLPRLTGGTGIGGSSMGLNVSDDKHSLSSSNDSRPSTSAGRSTSSALSSSPSYSNLNSQSNNSNSQNKSSPIKNSNGNSMGNSSSSTASKSQPNHSILKTNDSSATIKPAQSQQSNNNHNLSSTGMHTGLNSNGVSFADEVKSGTGRGAGINKSTTQGRGSGDNDSFMSNTSNDGEYFDAKNGSDSGLSRSNTLSSQQSARGAGSNKQPNTHSKVQSNMNSSNTNQRQESRDEYDPYSYGSQSKATQQKAPSGASATSAYGNNYNPLSRNRSADRKTTFHSASNTNSDDEGGYRSGRDARPNHNTRGKSPDSDYFSNSTRPRPSSRTSSHHGQQAPFRGHEDMPVNIRNQSYRSDGGFSDSSEMRNYYQDGFHAAERDRETIREDVQRLSMHENDWSDDSERYSYGSSNRDRDVDERSSQTSYGSSSRRGQGSDMRNGSDTEFVGRMKTKEVPRAGSNIAIPPPLVSRDTYTNNTHYSPPSAREEVPRQRNMGLSVERKMDVAYEAGYKDAIEKIKRDMLRNLSN